jgi:hypothetical protein
MSADLPTTAMMEAGAKALNDCGLGLDWTLTALDATADSVWRAMQDAANLPDMLAASEGAETKESDE